MLKIVLASQSPRRKKLLSQLGLTFDVKPSTCEEIITSNNPVEVVSSLSLQKAEEVSSRCANSLVIGSDTIVVLDGQILGKPENERNAIDMLNSLSGRQHSVFTGVALVTTNGQAEVVKSHTFVEETIVTFSELSIPEIESYVAGGSPMDKAGSYGIQDDWGSVFVEKIEGDFYNVVGFPLNRFYREMKEFEPQVFTT
ncbi:MAG: septum formation inhibitor Maf [Balneolaceae bacterium]|nr:septum formation inhibitor Maf [Balneolaceae bacterium]